jgi:hypothetical protein
MKRNKPFIFVTGYRSETIDSRFKDIAVLQKPVDRAMLADLFQASPPPKLATV